MHLDVIFELAPIVRELFGHLTPPGTLRLIEGTRGELYWDTDTTGLSAPPGDAIEPKDAPVLRDAAEPKDASPDGNFAERWRALDGR